MRLTNADNQSVIKNLLPDSIGNFADILIDEPKQKPNSATVKFWDEWSRDTLPDVIGDAVQAMRQQGR